MSGRGRRGPGQRRQAGGRHDERRTGVGEHRRDAGRRVVGVDREVGGPRLVHGEHGHDRLGRAGQGQGHHVAPADAPSRQHVRQPVGPLVEGAVGERAVAVDDGHGVGRAVDLCLEPGGQRVRRRCAGGAGARSEGQRPLVGGEQVEGRQRPVLARRVAQGVEHPHEPVEVGVHLVGPVAGGVGLDVEHEARAVAAVVGRDREVVHRAGGDGLGGRRRSGEAQPVVEGHVVHGRPDEPEDPAGDPQVTAQVLAAVPLAQGGLLQLAAHLVDQRAHRGVGSRADAQRQDVGQHPGLGAHRRARAGGDRQPEDQVGGAGDPVEVGGERGRDEARRAPAGGRGRSAQPGVLLGRQRDGAPQGLAGGRRVGARQPDGLGRAREAGAPPLAVAFGGGRGGVGDVALGEAGQRPRRRGVGRPAGDQRRVHVGRPSGQHRGGEAVGHDVVASPEPPGAVGGAEQQVREQRLAGVERPAAAHRVGHGGVDLGPGVGRAAEVDDRQLPPHVEVELLDGPAVVVDESNQPDLGLPGHVAQRGLEPRRVDRAVDLDQLADGEALGAGVDLFGQPDVGLGTGEGEPGQGARRGGRGHVISPEGRGATEARRRKVGATGGVFRR